MLRRVLIRPDSQMQTPDGRLIEFVSREALASAMLEAASVLATVGGHLTIAQDRVKTGVEHEMLPRLVAMEWRDRTDAKPQPEQENAVEFEVEHVEPRPGEEMEWEPQPGDPVEMPLDGTDLGLSQDEITAALSQAIEEKYGTAEAVEAPVAEVVAAQTIEVPVPGGVAANGINDGLVESELPDEDVSGIPEELR